MHNKNLKESWGHGQKLGISMFKMNDFFRGGGGHVLKDLFQTTGLLFHLALHTLQACPDPHA